jgi:hypothetical protein
MKRIFGFTGFAKRRQTDGTKEKYNKLINLIEMNRL